MGPTVSVSIWMAMIGGLGGGFVLGWLSGLQASLRERQALWSVHRDLQEDLDARDQINTYLTDILVDPSDPMNQRRRTAWLARVRPNLQIKD